MPVVIKELDIVVAQCLAFLDAAGVAPQQPLISAVSGGPDSLALAIIMQQVSARRGSAHSAVIIDHGFRAEARSEAENAATQLAKLGIVSQITPLLSPKPSGNLQEFARKHRLTLLAEAGRMRGAAICFGHHMYDQAETIYMRLAKDSGLKGLAGMPKLRMHEGCLFLRPLLETSPEILKQICAHAQMVPAQDPSNEDRRFERVRVRQHLRAEPQFVPNLLRLGEAAKTISTSLDTVLKDRIRRHLHWQLPYCGSIQASCFLSLPEMLRHRCLALMLQTIGRNDYTAPRAAIARLDAHLMKGRDATLAGCLVRILDGQIHFVREARHLPEAIIIEGAESRIFDDCWLITGQSGMRWTALGAKRYAELPKKALLRRYLSRWPYPARLRFPVLDPLDEEAGAPHFKDMDAWIVEPERVENPFELRLPITFADSITSWPTG